MMDRHFLASNPSAAADSRRARANRLHLESLEDRRLLVAKTYVNDNWTFQPGYGPTLEQGDLVRNSLDSGDIVNAEYGYDAFGTVEGLSLSQFATIHSAIDATDLNGELNLLLGTFKESDIVIDKPITVLGTKVSGASTSVIVPEVRTGL
jgi:hypothetical protein